MLGVAVIPGIKVISNIAMQTTQSIKNTLGLQHNKNVI